MTKVLVTKVTTSHNQTLIDHKVAMIEEIEVHDHLTDLTQVEDDHHSDEMTEMIETTEVETAVADQITHWHDNSNEKMTKNAAAVAANSAPKNDLVDNHLERDI